MQKPWHDQKVSFNMGSQAYTVAMAHIASNTGSDRWSSVHSRLTDVRSNTSVELKV